MYWNKWKEQQMFGGLFLIVVGLVIGAVALLLRSRISTLVQTVVGAVAVAFVVWGGFKVLFSTTFWVLLIVAAVAYGGYKVFKRVSA